MDAPRITFNDGKLWIECRPPAYITPQVMAENMRSALALGLKRVTPCASHDGILIIAGGGPSLEDTWPKIVDAGQWASNETPTYLAAVNGSLGYLLEKDLVPHFCGVMDANEWMADVVAADKRVTYLAASSCNPALWAKLAGCDIRLWHPTPDNIGASPDLYHVSDGVFTLIGKNYLGEFAIGGGTNIALRMIQIGYLLGFRHFHLYGVDASFRDNNTHVYADRRNGEWAERSSLEIMGYQTSLNFMQHVTSLANMLEHMLVYQPDAKIEMFGDGLLQACFNYWRSNRDIMGPVEAFQQW